MKQSDTKSRKSMGKSPAIAAGGIVAAAAAVYIGGSLFFGSRFLPNTTVNGVPASAATVDTVKERIQKEAADYKLTLVEADGSTEEITQSDVDLQIDTEDGQIESFLESQSGWGWVGALFSGDEFSSENIVSYDRNKLESTVNSLNCVTDANPVITENAKPLYEGGEFVAVEEVYGTNINKKAFTKKLGKALLNLLEEVDLKEDKFYVQPEVKADSDEFKSLLRQMNGVINTSVNYQVGSNTETVDKDTIASWISTDDSKVMIFNDIRIREFLDEMGAKYNTFGQPKQLKTSSGATVTVPGGPYGWKIDKDGEVARLEEQLLSNEDVNRDFVYQYTAASHDGPDYGNSYVEVNLTAQHVYLYSNGSLVCDTACVSGNPSRGNGTHTGAFPLTYKEKDATLNGEDYSTPVNYWMPFNGNEGLHDATWRSNFGGSIYKTNGSHGCVNLPLSAAAKIFPVVETGFPVLVYTMGGTETSETQTEAPAEETQETEASPQEQAQAVIDKINIIGPVTSESGPAIKDARSSYEALSDEAKSYVSNASTLSEAEAAFAGLPPQAEPQQPDLGALQAQADSVASAIAAIGPVTAESGPAIEAAEAAYANLSEDARGLVLNSGELASKRAEYNALMGQ